MIRLSTNRKISDRQWKADFFYAAWGEANLIKKQSLKRMNKTYQFSSF